MAQNLRGVILVIPPLNNLNTLSPLIDIRLCNIKEGYNSSQVDFLAMHL